VQGKGSKVKHSNGDEYSGTTRVILSGAWTTSTCYKPREIERSMFMKCAYLFEYETRGPYNTLVKVPSEIIVANRPRPCHNSRHAHAPESSPRALPSTPAAPTEEGDAFTSRVTTLRDILCCMTSVAWSQSPC